MATKRLSKSNTIDVNGLSIQDILNLDFETVQKLSEKSLRTLTSRLVSASNKRIRRLEKSGVSKYSQALSRYEKGFSIKGKEKQGQVMSEFARASRFLNLKTSTVQGTKKVMKEVHARIEKMTGGTLTSEQTSKVFSALHRAQESGMVQGRGSKGSDKYLQLLIEEMKEEDMDIDSLLEQAEEDYTEWYEEQEELENEEDETNGIDIF